MSVVYCNGLFLSREQASIPIDNRGFLYGEGVFRTMRVENGEVIHCEAQLQKLYADCQALNLSVGKLPIQELIQKNAAERGVWKLKVIISCTHNTHTLMTLEPYVKPFEVATLCMYPHSIAKPFSSIKTLSYLDRLHVKQYALQNGCEDAIVVDQQGNILETGFANIFWEEAGIIYYPRSSLPFLKGVTLSEFCKKNPGQEIATRIIPKTANIYICNSLLGVIPAKLKNDSPVI